MSARPPYRLTNIVLSAGTLSAAACLALGLLLSLTGGASAREWALAGTLLLLGTPALGLLATAAEMRATQPRSAVLALAVLGVLGAAVLVALA